MANYHTATTTNAPFAVTSNYFGQSPFGGTINPSTFPVGGSNYNVLFMYYYATNDNLAFALTGVDYTNQSDWNELTVKNTTFDLADVDYYQYDTNSTVTTFRWDNITDNPFNTGTTDQTSISWDSVTSSDNTPENYTNLAGNKTGAALSTTYYATFSTTVPGTTSPGTGFSIGTQVSSGTAISVASGEYRINSGSWTSTAGTVNQNDTVYYRRASSGSYSTEVTGSLTIGDTTKTFTITTGAAPNTTPTGWNDVTIGNKSGQDVDVSEVWYADFDGTHTTTSPGAGFAISGLGTSITVTTSGAGDAISKDGTNWTTTSLTISNGETLYARITASSSYLSGRSQTITPGGGDAKAWTLTTKDNKPSAFDLGDTSDTAATGTYYSNTITVAGLDASTSVTASLSSDAGAGNFGYLKNGSTVANAANTTAANGDEFQVSHLTKTGNGTVTTTTLNLGSTSDSFTTTNAGNQAGWDLSATSSGYNEGDTVGMLVSAPTTSGANVDFWWSVNPTDVDASTGNGSTSYYNGSKTGTPPSNLGGFNWTATEDYTDDGAAGTGAITYTVKLFSDSNRTVQVASTTVDVNDTSQPLDPDTSISLILGSQTKSYAAGSDNGHAITFNNGATHTTYAVILDGATIGSATEYGSAQGLAATTQTISIADDNIAPGNQTTFRVVARRTTANNGNNVQQDTGVTYTISRRAQTPSIDSSALVDANVEDDDVTWRWTVSGGDGGTVKYSLDGAAYAAVSGGQVDKATTRGSSHTFTVISDATVDSTTASANTGTIPYLPSDTTNASVTGWSNENYSATTTDFTVNIANIVSNISWRVIYGATTPNTSAGLADVNGDILVSGTEFPTIGGSMNYKVQHRRATGVGGDNTWADFGSQFTKKRYTYAPAALAVSHDSLANTYANVTLDITPPGTTTGIAKYQVSQFKEKTDAGVDISSPSWSTPVDVAVGASPSYGTYNQARGDNETDYRVRAVGDNALNSAWVTVFNHNVGYLTAEAFTVTNNDSEDYAYDATASFDVDFSNTDASHTYQVVYGTATSPTTDGGQRTGDGVITLNNAEYPAAGTDMYYQVRVARATSIGGSGLFVNSGSEFIKGRYPYPASALETFTDGGTEAASGDFTIKVTAGTGANTTQITLASDYTNLQDNNTVVSSVVRAGDTIYARSTGANGLTTDTSFTTPATYLSPKAYTISTVSSDFAYSATDFDFTFTETDSDHTYGILYGTGASPSTVYGTELTGATSPQTINISGTAFPAAGNDMNYRARVKRGTTSGGDGTTWTNNAVIITKGRKPGAPASITISDHDDFAGVYFNVNVTSGNSDGASNYYAQQYKTFDDTGTAIPSPTWSSSVTMTSQEHTAFNQFRGDNTTQYRVRGRGANLLYSDWTTSAGSHGNYLDPDPDVGFFSSTLTVGQASTDAAVLVTGVARPTETVAVRVNNGSTNLAEDTPGGTNTSVAITFDHGLDPGQTGTYEIFTKRALSTGGDGSTYLATDDTFTVYRPDTTVDAFPFTDVTNADLSGTYYTYAQINDISEAVTASRTSGDALFQVTNNTTQPAANDAGWTATAKSVSDGQYIHLKGTASASYSTAKSTVISVGNPATTSTWTITTKPTATAFDLGFKADAKINTDYESNIITVAGLSGTSAVSVSGGSYSKNSAAYTTTAGTVQNDDTLRVKGTSAANYDGTTVNVTLTVEATSDIFDITTEVQPTVPTAISIPGDTTTASANVSMSCTASGGTGGTLKISEDDSTYDDDNVASYTFTRGTAKTLYAKRFGININSPLFTRAAYTLGYIPPDSTINNPSATASQPDRENFVVSLSGCSANNRYLVYNSAKTQVLGFSDFTGTTGNITFSDTSLAANSTGTYAIQVLKLETLGGDGLVDDTGKTFTVTYSPSGNAAPTISASVSNSNPGTSTSVTLSATASDSDGTISSIAWTQTGGTTTTPSPASNTNSSTISSTITTPSSPTTLTYYATATDDDAATGTSNTVTINVGGGGTGYGVLVKNSSGNDILLNTSTVTRIVSQSSTTVSWTSNNTTVTKDVAVTGMSSDGTWKVLIYMSYFDSNVGFTVTETTDKFTITASIGSNAASSQTVTVYYYVLRI